MFQWRYRETLRSGCKIMYVYGLYKEWKWYMHERHGVWKADFIDLGDIRSLIVGCDGMISQRFLAKAIEG